MTTSNSPGAMAVRGGNFAPRRVAFCLLPLLVLLLWIVALSSLATAGGTATASSPARIPVSIPARAAGAGVVMLELNVTVVTKPGQGHLGAVVRIKNAGAPAVEVGRLSIAGDSQSYQFNVSRALSRSAGGSAEVEVALVDRGGGPAPAGAALSIGQAELVTR